MKSHISEQPKLNGELQMNLYDVNKQIISQLPSLDEQQMEAAKKVIRDYIVNGAQEFYMLLGRDINYYTVFQITGEGNSAANEILECANYLGDIKSVEKTEDGAVEIWVHSREEDSTPTVLYLFIYDLGVIKCKQL